MFGPALGAVHVTGMCTCKLWAWKTQLSTAEFVGCASARLFCKIFGCRRSRDRRLSYQAVWQTRQAAEVELSWDDGRPDGRLCGIWHQAMTKIIFWPQTDKAKHKPSRYISETKGLGTINKYECQSSRQHQGVAIRIRVVLTRLVRRRSFGLYAVLLYPLPKYCVQSWAP